MLSYLLQKTLVVDEGVVFSHVAFPPLYSWTVDKQKKGRTKYIFAIEVCISSILATTLLNWVKLPVYPAWPPGGLAPPLSGSILILPVYPIHRDDVVWNTNSIAYPLLYHGQFKLEQYMAAEKTWLELKWLKQWYTWLKNDRKINTHAGLKSQILTLSLHISDWKVNAHAVTEKSCKFKPFPFP